MNVSMLNSQYEIYHAVSVASNMSASYYDIGKQFTATLLFKHIGRQLISYTDEKELLPFDIQFGLSKKLKHLPFRYSLAIHNLHQFDIKSPYKLISQTNGIMPNEKSFFIQNKNIF